MKSTLSPRGLLLFASGLILGLLWSQPSTAQSESGVKLSHVGIAVKDFRQAVDFYTKTMGFRQALAFNNPDGTPNMTYLQISRDTFLEIQPANDNRPPGITHLGVEVPNLEKYIAALPAAVRPARTNVSGMTGSLLGFISDPAGIRTELLEFPPGSAPRKAMESWK